MIEVEIKFQPTKEQKEKLLAGAEFLGEKTIHDIYYDYPDFRFFTNQTRFRRRNGFFELKIKKTIEAHLEIEDAEEIKKYLGTDNLEEFIKKNLILVTDYINKRKEYKKGEFTIDLDEMDFGYNLCEIEIMVENKEEIEEAQEKILNFAKEYNLELKKLPAKRSEYLRLFKPEIYKKIKGKEE
jgi:predicted adenylyl cyclase CyaB